MSVLLETDAKALLEETRMRENRGWGSVGREVEEAGSLPGPQCKSETTQRERAEVSRWL